MSLNNKLNEANAIAIYNPGNLSSRSSLYSVSSLEWDSKIDSPFRTHSLPRKSKRDSDKLYRTRSHSSFINSYIKDPEPVHFHVPKCNSCGTIISSYPRQSVKGNRFKSKYFSADNIFQRCIDEIEFINDKIKDFSEPILGTAISEFVESQEFNEDNYISDIGNDFASSNETVIEKDSKNDDNDLKEFKISDNNESVDEVNLLGGKPDNTDIYKATPVNVFENNDNTNDLSLESTEGEYHSFSDDLEFEHAAYESPVRDLVGKDIRDYSVPINFYCDDYNRKESPRKSPKKIIDLSKKPILEPILEESKMGISDSSNDSNNNESNIDKVSENITVEKVLATSKDIKEPNNDINKTNLSQSEDLSNAKTIKDDNNLTNDRLSSVSGLSSIGKSSLDSTAEFEKYEIVTDIVSSILKKFDSIINEKKIYVAEDILTKDVKEKDEYFSIAEIVKDIEKDLNLNETVLTETSEIDDANKIIEAVMYYIFDSVFHICAQNHKKVKTKRIKNVITVVDLEDILFTTSQLWLNFYENPTSDTSFINDNKDINDDNSKLSEDLSSNFLETSLKLHEATKLNETYIIDKAMNTAFIGDEFSLYRGDIFKECTESPIKHIDNSFIGDDLSVLYEKDDTILGSPFVKKANILQMSQTAHSGGIKYWLSFDDTLPIDEPKCKSRRNKELPSFLRVEFNDENEINDKSDVNDNNEVNDDDSLVANNDTFLTETCSNYNTCESNSRIENSVEIGSVEREKLLFDLRKKCKRLYSTWPSYEHALYFKIVSKFRTAESLDLSDFNFKFDSSF